MAVFRTNPGAAPLRVLAPAARRRAVAGGDGDGDGNEDSAEVTPVSGASTTESSADSLYIIGSVIGLAIMFLIAMRINKKLDPDLTASVEVAEGLGLFALFYIYAQTIERLLEPLSKFVLPTAKEALLLDQLVRDAKNHPDSVPKANAAAEAQAALNRKRANRTSVFWAIATGLGFLAAAGMKAYFLKAVGVQDPQPWQEILVTGAVIGAGTKPLHDLITRIEKKKEQTTDPAETAGGG